MSETSKIEYSVAIKALRKWARECVSLNWGADGSVDAAFRFSGSTCTNLGYPIELSFKASLSSDLRIRSMEIVPFEGDEGWQRMCVYKSDTDNFVASLQQYQPLIGCSLEEAARWEPRIEVSGCLCSRENQNHKWRNALQAIHYAMQNYEAEDS